MSQTQQTVEPILTIQPETPTEQGNAGSLLRLLSNNLGKEVTGEFMVGVEEIVYKSGTLRAVNTDYLVIATPRAEVVCDLYSLRFMTFYLPGVSPDSNVSPAENAPSVGQTGRTHAQAAFNYAKRKTRKLE